MRIVALFCNIGLFLFTCFVLLTDGPPKETVYIILTMWALLTLILSAVVIIRVGASDGWLGLHLKRKALEDKNSIDGRSSLGTVMNIAAIICNLVLFGLVCWSLVDQYPHPREAGFIEFATLMVLTPILNLVVLFRNRTYRLQATPGVRLG